jgi:transposase
MPWTPTRLTKAQLEERRLHAAQHFSNPDFNRSQLARDLGVSRQSIKHWYHQWNTHSESGLRAVPHPGPGKSITAEQINTWLQALKRGAKAHGFESDVWTTGRATVVLERVSGIAYHPDHVRKLLREHGWSVQKPARQGMERDEASIQTWVETTLDLLEKNARQGRRSSSRMKSARV